ncbi:AAA family ATPase [Sansalvadorimonas verongulae]|uniref:AAA family ATPase n=1 Tax=Sansalvadorimonas verongulae TaxID=2172824 RepID=UPI0012BC89E7|nr:hypothetical protein [Sansalvadorimonas verongulae]MTI15559.1 hypothetical protein [Sansalvadorimonas verongulae]
MLDFSKNPQSSTQSTSEQPAASTIEVFYQTQACLTALEEACRLEGMDTPAPEPFNRVRIPEQIKSSKASLIFIETSTDTEEFAAFLRHLVSRQHDIVLIGSDDSIRLIRKLASLGFYYLLWPASRPDIVELMRGLQNNHALNNRPQSARNAMRIAVVGVKGGCGSSMVAVELARNLLKETSQPVLLADHNYQDSNHHILLGRQSLGRKPVDAQTLASFADAQTVDAIHAQSQLFRLQTNFHYLGLENTEIPSEDIWRFTQGILETQAKEHSFIIEDYSSMAKYLLISQKTAMVDCLIVVVPPSLSGLYGARTLLQHLGSVHGQAQKIVRTLTIINHNQPNSTVKSQDAEEYLQCTLSAELPWQPGCENYLTEGRGLPGDKLAVGFALENLARCILGKPQAETSLWHTVKQWCLQ